MALKDAKRPPPLIQSPSTLVAFAFAANRSGDKGLELVAIEELRERFGIELKFRRPKRGRREEVAPHAP